MMTHMRRARHGAAGLPILAKSAEFYCFKSWKSSSPRVISLLNEAVQAQNGRASAFRLSGLDATRLKRKYSAMDRFNKCLPVLASEV